MTDLLNPDDMPAWLAKQWPQSSLFPLIIAGVNDDDCSVIRWSDDYVVITTDYVNAWPIAIELGIGSIRTLGRLAVAANLSDLIGSGARPRGLLIAVTMKRGSNTEEFKELMRGVKLEAKRWNVPIIGGDTKLGESTAILGVGIGSVESKNDLFLKTGGEVGDLVWVSGYIGSNNAAVLGWDQNNMSQNWRKWAIRVITVPQLPLKMSQKVSQLGFGHGGTDISDGLGIDLKNLCLASKVGVVIKADKLPISKYAKQYAIKNKIPPWVLAFGVGGDFQFIVTTCSLVKSEMESLGFFNIGKITKQKKCLLELPNKKKIPMPLKGHVDRQKQTFTEEIKKLILGVNFE